LTFPINKALLSGGLVVNDDQVRAAMRFAFQSMKLVVEPGGAAALAAALAGLAPRGDGATVVVVSGRMLTPISCQHHCGVIDIRPDRLPANE
jgi:threonine dehydratase